MKFRLLSAAALAAIGAGGASDPADTDAAPEPGQGGTDAAKDPAGTPPADQSSTTTDKADANGDPVDVVAAADVKDLTAAAHAKGFAEANARMKAVFDSPEGKADASTAAFLLATSNGSAADIIGHMQGRAPAAAPAATGTAPAPIADTTVAITTDPTALANEGGKAEAASGWDAALAKRAAANAPIVPAASAGASGTIPARAIPRTGN